MARFWNQLDKADIAVPLVFTKYSDVSEMQHLHNIQQHHPHKQLCGPLRANLVAIETQPSHRDLELDHGHSNKGPIREKSCESVTRQDYKHWRVRPEPSCKPKNEYHIPDTPFNNETQYQKDYKPWPIPKRGDHPWITKPGGADDRVPDRSKHVHGGGAGDVVDSGVEKSQIADKVQEKEILQHERKKRQVVVAKGEKRVGVTVERRQQQGELTAEGKPRAAVDALNRQIKQEAGGSSYRYVMLYITSHMFNSLK